MSLFVVPSAASSISLAEVIRIEDCPELLDLRCQTTGIPIWPVVRLALIRLIMGDFLYNAPSLQFQVASRSSRAGFNLSRAFLHNASLVSRRRLRADILINTEAVGDELADGKWYNRYVDPFGDVTPGEAMVMTDMFEWTWPMPRHNERLYFHAPIQAEAALRGRLPLPAAACRQAAELVDLVEKRARTLIGWELGKDRKVSFERFVATRIALLPVRYRRYRQLLRRARPRLLLGSSSCYGFHAPLIAAARDLGVITAEYQHGAISAGHDAYNYAATVSASDDYRRTLPQYLLTYGDWWNTQIDVPVETISIGYPARAKKLSHLRATPDKRDSIMLLGDGVEFDLYLDLAREIAAALGPKGFRTVLRPHPLERTRVVEQWGKQVGDVIIDDHPDIYTSFRAANAVISEVSSGLFEAVGLADRVIMLDTPKARFAFPKAPFAVAASSEELIRLIADNEAARPQIGSEALWAPDWQRNYRHFLAEKIGYDFG